VTIDTSAARFDRTTWSQFSSFRVARSLNPSESITPTLEVSKDIIGYKLDPVVDAITAEESGAIRSSVLLRGTVVDPTEVPPYSLSFEARLHCFAGSAVVRIEFTIRNTQRAAHPGGLWDLGDAGSVFLEDASFA